MASSEAALGAQLGWRFQRPELLTEALTHASANEGRTLSVLANYERLEFLGDRILGLVVAEELFTRFPHLGEAGLALQLNALVNRGACARAARRAGLGAHLILSKAEAQAGGRDKETILADVCEAVIAALYLDGGLAVARAFIERYWGPEWAHAGGAAPDPKTALQEWAAAKGLPLPRYEVIERTGPDHAPAFAVRVTVEAVGTATGSAGSKRDAERAAARALLERAV